MKFFLCFILILLFSTLSSSQENFKIINQGSNYRIYPSNTSQTEVFIIAHPSNPDILFASANTIRLPLFKSEGIYVTTNGGNSWYGSDTCKGQYIQFHGGDPGIAIDKDGRFIITHLGIDPFPGLYSHYSTDNGITWSVQATLTNDYLERATIATDANPLSSYYGRTHVVWAWLLSPFPIFYTYTDNGGVSWNTPVQLNNPPQRCLGGEIAVGPNGNVIACWPVVTNISPFTEIAVGFASSGNGGADWIIQENAFSMNGIQGQLNEKNNIRVNGYPRLAVDTSGGERNGWIYIVTTQKNLAPAGLDPDIIFNRSTDGGTTWSAGIRVNQDQMNNGKDQYFPAVHVDKQGGINILYYDDRNTTSDSVGVFLSRSTDGGITWADYQISDHNFRPYPLSGGVQGYQGDNIGLTSANNILWPVWMDNSSGVYQIWTAPTPISLLDTENDTNPSILSGFNLKQNYPNPFNAFTNIEYTIPEDGFVSLKLYNINGREAAELRNEFHSAGNYKVQFNADAFNLSSGVYFLRLKGEKDLVTRSIILLK